MTKHSTKTTFFPTPGHSQERINFIYEQKVPKKNLQHLRLGILSPHFYESPNVYNGIGF